jgi:copper chaperone CopZ
MDFNATIDLIIKDLREAAEIIDDLKKYPGVPAIQVELAKSKCKSAGEIIALFKNLQDSLPKDVNKEPVIPDSEVKEKTSPEIQRTIKHEPSRASKKDGSSLTIGKKSESAIIADTFSHLSSKLNEQLGSLREDEDDVSDFLKAQPLTNLSEAIGVNDKFLFIREIFSGNQESYNQAISRIEEAESLADARAILLSYTAESKENDAAKLLLDLVKRKFPSDE